jgi:hypothetical protein
MWKPVVGYEGIYEVSKDGQVRTVEGKTTFTERHGKRKWKQRVLKQKVSKDKTCRVNLWKDGKDRTWLVHRVVALAFIPLIEGKDYINHKDGSRLNNHIDNLEWCDHTENNNHAFTTGLITSNHPVTLVNTETKEELKFRSKAKASKFLGKTENFVSSLLLKNKTTYQSWEIKI